MLNHKSGLYFQPGLIYFGCCFHIEIEKPQISIFCLFTSQPKGLTFSNQFEIIQNFQIAFLYQNLNNFSVYQLKPFFFVFKFFLLGPLIFTLCKILEKTRNRVCCLMRHLSSCFFTNRITNLPSYVV